MAEAVRHGLSNPEIAAGQGVSHDAVKYHVANILQKLGFSSRAQLRFWDGVRRDSALAKKDLPMNETLSVGAIGQVARSVKDIKAASHWYGQVLGLKPLYTFGNLAFFDCDGVRLFLSEGDGEPAHSTLYFRVDDVRSAYTALRGRGVEFIDAPHMIHKHANGTEEWMAFFKDNEGRPLAIMAQVHASAEP